MVEIALGVALGLILSVVFFVGLSWAILETLYLVWLWKEKRKRR